MASRNAEMETIIAKMRAAPGVDYPSLAMPEARRIFEASAAVWNSDEPPLERVELSIPSAVGAMRARLHLPHGREKPPLIVYAHGGGWTFGSIESHGATMARLAEASGAAVLGMDYRLAPEHPYPAPLDDVVTAINFAESGGLGARVDATRLGLAGDSAGANLALAALLRRRDAGKPSLRAAALFYGCYLPLFTTESHNELGGGDYLLTTAIMRWYWANFLGGQAADTRSLAAPYHADLAGLPPVYLTAAGLDPLRDDTLMLADKLARAHVDFRFDHVPGVVHGYLRMANELTAARRSNEAAGRFFAELL